MESSKCVGRILLSSQKYDANIETFLEELEKLPKHCICIDGQDDALHDVGQFIRLQVGSWKKYEFLPKEGKRNFEAAKKAIIKAVIDTAGQM